MNDFQNNQLINKEDDVDLSIRTNNYRLTADKIRQNLDSIRNDPHNSPRRWVWELIQNAKDIKNQVFERVSIKIILSQDKLVFMHNGDPFIIGHITSLIQQVSSKDSVNSDQNVTGKNGTGFITTHLLSDIINVKGVVRHRGVFREFTVELDRSGRTSEELLPKIENALERVRKIEDPILFPPLDDYSEQRTEGKHDTSFTYFLSSNEKLNAAIHGVEDLINTLPITLVNNFKTIKKVEVINEIKNLFQIYESKIIDNLNSIKKVKVTIHENMGYREKNFLLYYLDELTLSTEVDDFSNLGLLYDPGKHPNLYRDFPLIGSEKFYFPFILNGFRFWPKTERNGITLHSEESPQSQENRTIIESAFNAAKNFTQWLVKNNAKNLYVPAYSRLPLETWSEGSRKWYQGLQKDYRNFLLNLDLVEVDHNGKRETLTNCRIPNYGASDETKLTFYGLAKKFLGEEKVPVEKIAINWIESTGPKEEIDSWGEKIQYNLEDLLKELNNLLNIENLTQKIGSEQVAFKWLNDLIGFLFSNKESFDEFAIIPNQLGVFKKLEDLKIEDKQSPIPDEFLDVFKLVENDWRDQLINRKIIMPEINLDKLGLADLSAKLNAKLREEKKNYLGVYENEFLKRENAFDILLDIIRNVDQGSTREDFRSKIFFKAKTVFASEKDLRTVGNVKDFSFTTPLKLLIELINKKIESFNNVQGLASHLSKTEDSAILWLDKYLNLLTKEDFSMLLEYGNIIPNREGDFISYKGVFGFGTVETPLNDELIKILRQLDPEKDWKKDLVIDGVSLNLTPRKFDELGTAVINAISEIEKEELLTPGYIQSFKAPIFALIEWCRKEAKLAEDYLAHFIARSNDLWIKFSMTNEMISILKNEDSLVILKEISSSNIQVSDIRKLLEITQKLNNFGLNGIKEILEHAEDLLDVKRHFHFMKETGENIEKLFSETLESEQLQIDIQTQGWGSHDFMISNKLDPQKRIFIELKSYKNGTNHDFKFASSQVKKSLENPEDYFVCMLERPENDVPATVEYLKTKLQYKTNLSNLTMEVISDIKDFERINSRNGAVKLVIDQRQEPRVHIAFPLMQENSQSFYQLITEIKNRLI